MESPFFEDKELELTNNSSMRVSFCGLRAPMWTSWSDENPNRRFIGCSNYRNRGRKCDFFAWIDPEISEREKKIMIAARLRSEIVELKHNKEKKELQIEKLVDENEKLKKKYLKQKEAFSRMEEGKTKAKQRQVWFLIAIFMVWTILVAVMVENVGGNGQLRAMLMP